MLDPIRRVGRAEVGEVRAEPHLQIDDADTRLPKGGQGSSRRPDRGTRDGDIDSGALEHPAFGCEIVLHVHHECGGHGWVDGDRPWLGIYRDRGATSVRIHGGPPSSWRLTPPGSGARNASAPSPCSAPTHAT